MFREMTVFPFARLAGILALACIVGGCSAMPSKSGKLPTPPQRLQLGGVSFLPPNETGWFVAQRSPQVLTLIKQTFPNALKDPGIHRFPPLTNRPCAAAQQPLSVPPHEFPERAPAARPEVPRYRMIRHFVPLQPEID